MESLKAHIAEVWDTLQEAFIASACQRTWPGDNPEPTGTLEQLEAVILVPMAATSSETEKKVRVLLSMTTVLTKC